jgi:sulfite exporter TauE/SafE
MAMFGAGTVPAMAMLMFSKKLITLTLRHRINRTVPVLVSMLACLLILRGLSLGIPYISPVRAAGNILNCCEK